MWGKLLNNGKQVGGKYHPIMIFLLIVVERIHAHIQARGLYGFDLEK